MLNRAKKRSRSSAVDGYYDGRGEKDDGRAQVVFTTVFYVIFTSNSLSRDVCEREPRGVKKAMKNTGWLQGALSSSSAYSQTSHVKTHA